MSQDPEPIACSLGATDLQERLDRIRALGARSLLESANKGSRHILRFRHDEETRRALAEIVAAESRCCPFLQLDLREEAERLSLAISAPAEGAETAAALAAAFANPYY